MFDTTDWRSESYFGSRGVIAPGDTTLGPRGQVAFNDNMVSYDAQSDALTISLCAIAILSFDDVGMHDNVCALDLATDFVLVNAAVFGLISCRVIGNRFRETLRTAPLLGIELPSTILSAATFGILNATEMNQGDYCFLALGLKKPRVILETVGDVSTARLDTNRHLVPEELCTLFDRMSRRMGDR
jgi:hypothetical protein